MPAAERYPQAIRAHLLAAVTRNAVADAPGTIRHAREALRIEAALGLPPYLGPRLQLARGAIWDADFETAAVASADALQAAEGQSIS